MKILLTVPTVNAPNGGIANIIQLANHLQREGHKVVIFTERKGERSCTWRPCIVPVVNKFQPGVYDLIIINSPHSIWIEDRITTEKAVIFCQMAEHFFRPDDKQWENKCMQFYLSDLPMLSYSYWNIGYFKEIGRTAETFYMPTAVDQNEFPIHRAEKSNTILVESPFPNNPSKDRDQLSIRLSQEPALKGYEFISYGAKNETPPFKYYKQPSVKLMNDLYSTAKIMLKATIMDARACAPLEAMTKGTVTVRAIDYGDDDLVHKVNCMRSKYVYEEYRDNALELLGNEKLIDELSERCYETVSKLTWNNFINQMFKYLYP